jgi:hypothetical protein
MSGNLTQIPPNIISTLLAKDTSATSLALVKVLATENPMLILESQLAPDIELDACVAALESLAKTTPGSAFTWLDQNKTFLRNLSRKQIGGIFENMANSSPSEALRYVASMGDSERDANLDILFPILANVQEDFCRSLALDDSPLNPWKEIANHYLTVKLTPSPR